MGAALSVDYAYAIPVARRSYVIDSDPYSSYNDVKKLTFKVNGETLRELIILEQFGANTYLVHDITVTRPLQLPQKFVVKVVRDNIEEVQENARLLRKLKRDTAFAQNLYEDYTLKSTTISHTDTLFNYYELGSLQKILNARKEPFSQKQIDYSISNVSYSLGLLHGQRPGLIHGNIALDTIYAVREHETGIFMLIVSGLEVSLEKDPTNTRNGPPEQTNACGKASDIWNFGVVLYQLMTLDTNTTCTSRIQDWTTEQEQHKLMRKKLQSMNTYNDEIIDLVLSMLKYNPQDRPTAFDLFVKKTTGIPMLARFGCLTKSYARIEKLAKEFNLFEGAKTGDMSIVQLMIDRGAKEWNRGLRGACISGNKEIIMLMIQKGAKDWQMAFHGACYGGQRAIIEWLISENHYDWNYGLKGACEGGWLDIVQEMIEIGANDWNGGLYYACLGGWEDIAQLMLNKGADNINDSLWRACEQGKTQVVLHLLDKGAGGLNKALRGACHNGDIELINIIIRAGATSWNLGLMGACEDDHKNIVEMMIRLGADDFNYGLQGACADGNMTLIRYMIEKGANDWNLGLHKACFFGRMNAIDFMLEKGAKDFNGGLRNACRNNQIATIKKMIEKGANAEIVAKEFPSINL